jgi:hypothetical protein
MKIVNKYFLGTFFLLAFFSSSYSQAASDCSNANLGEKAAGLCNAYCESLDCTDGDNSDSNACQQIKGQYISATGEIPPCEASSCSLIEAGVLFERISYISNPDYICYSDSDTPPYTYVEYIIESEGAPQIGLGMEDQFDGTWYGYYFEYQPESPGELPEFFRYDLTPDEVDACRAAFEPPFSCP